MHPAFVNADPKARCPECGMKLVPRSADVDADAATSERQVAGLAPVELSPDRVQLMGVRTAVATREALGSTIRAPGFVAVDDTRLIAVSARFPGWIEAIAAGNVGQLVEKGDLLATLYSPDAVQAQQQLLAVTRWSDPKSPGPRPAGTEYQREARTKLELFGFAPQDIDELIASGAPNRIMKIRAPVRGFVGKKSILAGAFVQPGAEMFQVADLSSVWVVVDVYAGDIRRIRVGQKAQLEVPTYPGERYSGRIAFIYPALAVSTRSLQARIEMRNPGLHLRPGMYGDVTIETGASPAVVVPAEAIVDTGEARYVFVAQGAGRFEPRPVTVGWTENGRAAILAGVAEGERVVTTASFLVDSESRMRSALEGFGRGAAPR
jgi:multidrug efflux pump subunit AcrA (membrane-fusion protein)